MGIIDVVAEKIANYVANDVYSAFDSHVRCMECNKVFIDEKHLLLHSCAVKKRNVKVD